MIPTKDGFKARQENQFVASSEFRGEKAGWFFGLADAAEGEPDQLGYFRDNSTFGEKYWRERADSLLSVEQVRSSLSS